MTQKLGTRVLSVTTAIVLSLSMAGCASAGSTDHSAHGDQKQSAPAAEPMSADDIMFAQMMIVHHQQAVDMGVLAETRAGSEVVKKLAAEIKDEQAPEIELMKSWLEAAGAPLEMGHSMAMPGLLSDSQMANLEAASGDQFDKLYLLSMIEHHRGAIDMARAVEVSENGAVRELAGSIISSQTDQIAYIESLLGNN